MVQAIELADALAKTELVRKHDQIQKAGSEMDQRQAASSLKEKTAAGTEKAQEAEKSDLVIISKDQEKEKEKKKFKKGEYREGDDDSEDDGTDEPRHLDLKA
nr:hypothetical protein [candidate division Zixibacteria bacterium]